MCEGPWTKHIRDQRPGLVRRAMVNFRGAVPIGRLPWGVREPICPMHTHRYATCTPTLGSPMLIMGLPLQALALFFRGQYGAGVGLVAKHLSSILNSTTLFL